MPDIHDVPEIPDDIEEPTSTVPSPVVPQEAPRRFREVTALRDIMTTSDFADVIRRAAIDAGLSPESLGERMRQVTLHRTFSDYFNTIIMAAYVFWTRGSEVHTVTFEDMGFTDSSFGTIEDWNGRFSWFENFASLLAYELVHTG